jgi:glyoxylase-like metal-dependent hydrolase (beta-lactamase superfamily II)
VVPEKAEANCADMYIQDGQILSVGEVIMEAMPSATSSTNATPGHTDSHNAYLVNNHSVLTGDALLIRGCGRTDFQSGDAGTLYDSVTQRLFTLPDETLVYPGHDYRGHTVSTIGEEKRFNLRFAGRTRDNFIELMANLHLPNPKKIMEAVPANEMCGRLQAVTA